MERYPWQESVRILKEYQLPTVIENVLVSLEISGEKNPLEISGEKNPPSKATNNHLDR